MNDKTHLTNYYKRLHNDGDIPTQHIKYLYKIEEYFNIKPNVIFDIGSAILHWTKNAKKIWKDSRIIAFEAMEEVEDFYKDYGVEYEIGVFSDTDDKELIFYNNPIYLGGNSYYKENSKYSSAAEKIYLQEFETKRITKTIDTIIKEKNLPLPDLVKIDVQGAEIDILNGMKESLINVKHLIVELQHVQYNIGAKMLDESFPIIKSFGFELVPLDLIIPEEKNNYFCGNGPDCDYHFIKKCI